MAYRSPFHRWAAEEVSRLRLEFQDVIENEYARAVEECNAVLLNRAGQAARVDEWSLFKGPQSRAEKWASEELRDFWARNGRLTFEEYERQAFFTMFGGHEEEGL